MAVGASLSNKLVSHFLQVTDETRKMLLDRYEFEYRGPIEVKGVDGKMHTYLLSGRKGEPPLAGKNAQQAAS